MQRRILPILALALLLPAGPSSAQTVSGRLFEDRNANGILDPGELVMEGVAVGLFGALTGGAAFEDALLTGADGGYSFAPGDGTFLMELPDPAGWRLGPVRRDRFPESTFGYDLPVGVARFSKLDQGVGHLRAGALSMTVLGDSIARNFNSPFGCSNGGTFWYSDQVQGRLAAAAPGASLTLLGAAVLGDHTDDLLDDDFDNANNVFRTIDAQSQLITISALGNDLLNVDVANPTQAETNRAVAEILDSRANLQEILSSLTSEIPGADISLNTLYDNLADACPSTSMFHGEWIPIMGQILRDLAWGQARRVSIVEVSAEFGQEGQAGTCSGFSGLICHGGFLYPDGIHPTNAGYAVVREKLWESVGGLSIGTADAMARSFHDDVDYGFLRRVRRLHPSLWAVGAGATVSNPESAFDDEDGGAAAGIRLGVGGEEFRLAGFPDWFDEIQIVKVIAGVRYRTSGAVIDNLYRMEASIGGNFRPPPGFDYSPTAWNFYTPIVGGGGPNMPPENPDYPDARLLVVPDVGAFREVSATLTKNPVLPPGADEYEWPPVDDVDLSTTAIRVAAAPVSATATDDGSSVELDAAWLDLYGWEKPRPGEVQNLALERLPDGTLQISFDALPGAGRHNVYFGRVASLGAYDHGAGAPAGPWCNVASADIGGGRLQIALTAAQQPTEFAYILVTAHVDDVESPTGHSSAAVEIDRSRSICR